MIHIGCDLGLGPDVVPDPDLVETSVEGIDEGAGVVAGMPSMVGSVKLTRLVLQTDAAVVVGAPALTYRRSWEDAGVVRSTTKAKWVQVFRGTRDGETTSIWVPPVFVSTEPASWRLEVPVSWTTTCGKAPAFRRGRCR